MFSNSVTVPAGTFREAVNEAEDSLCSPPLTSSVLASSDKKNKYLIGTSDFIIFYTIMLKLHSMETSINDVTQFWNFF